MPKPRMVTRERAYPCCPHCGHNSSDGKMHSNEWSMWKGMACTGCGKQFMLRIGHTDPADGPVQIIVQTKAKVFTEAAR